jgi:hypothetical protein
VFGSNKKDEALATALAELQTQLATLQQDLARATEESRRELTSGLFEVRTASASIKAIASDLGTLRDSLKDGLRANLAEGLELIKPAVGAPAVSTVLGMPPMGSRELVEYWASRMEGGNARRKEAMAAYQASLRGSKG